MPPNLMMRIKPYINLCALIGGALVLAGLGYQFRFVSDWTEMGQHSLTPASIKILQSLPEPLVVTAYLPQGHPAKPQVGQFLDAYKRHHAALDFRFVDPSRQPQQVRDNDIKEGEIVINYAGRTERVNKLLETTFSAALARLARNEKRFIVFVSGHGERSPTRSANHDLSDWAASLTARGLNAQEVNLSEINAIPDNTSVLVIASPQLAYLPGELKLIAKYLAAGGNLLWLSDPEEPGELKPIAESLHVDKIPGTLVDPASLANGLDNPALLLATTYGSHPALESFRLTTLFVYANAFAARKGGDFTATTLVESGAKAWSETSELEGNVGLDDDSDFPGPLPIVLALERNVKARQQRVVLSGDGDFLANSYLGNAGNRDFGIRLLEWLASDDNMIDIPGKFARDRSLHFERWQIATIGFGFLLIIPGALILNGVLVWRKRKNA